jgi:hypothetical protein
MELLCNHLQVVLIGQSKLIMEYRLNKLSVELGNNPSRLEGIHMIVI